MKTTKILISASILSALTMVTNTYAGSVNEKLFDLHKRLQKIEAAEKEAPSSIQLSGVVEVEYGYTRDVDYTTADASDIVLATVELGIAAAINDNVDAEIVLLHEEDDTPLEVDTGVINLHDENSPVSLSLGQMYVPFGAYETNVVSDPLTLELGETRESTVLVNFEANGATAGFYLFNPELGEAADEDKATAFGVTLGYANDNFSAGVDYISSIADTDAVEGYLTDPGGLALGSVVEQVAGLSAHAMFSSDAMSVIFEYVGALDQFDVTEIAFNGVGAEPSAMNLEFAMNVPMGNREGTVAVAYQTTDEAVDLGLPESRMLIAFSTEIYEATSLAFEYLKDNDYSVSDGGSDESSDTFTVQLATEF